MEPTDIPPAVPILRPAALRSGYSDAEIRRFRKNGTWSSVRRGGYLPTSAMQQLDLAQRHALLIRATVPGLKVPAVVSHCSAAVLLGIPLWSTHLGIVHVTLHPPARSGGSAKLLIHAASIEPDEITMVDGIAVTDPARTVVDLARMLTFEQAVAAADAALHRQLTTPGLLAAAAAKIVGRPGSRAVQRAIRFADGLSESVGESRSRVMMVTAGIPRPVLQFKVHDAEGNLLGRSDYSWRKGRVLGEFDGLVKYGRLLRRGESAGDVVVREKIREDALRDNGARVVRWVWADLGEPKRVIERIRRALDAVGDV